MSSLDWVRTFVAVYRHRSITRAAQELHLTQPAVSQQIRALESQLGAKLFLRLARGVAPTPEAHEIARVAASPVDMLSTLLTSARATAESLAGTVHLGGPADFISSHVIRVLGSVVERGIRIRFHFGNTGDLLERIGEIDLLIATEKRPKPSVEYEFLAEEDFVLVGAPAWGTKFPLDELPNKAPRLSRAQAGSLSRRAYRSSVAIFEPYLDRGSR